MVDAVDRDNKWTMKVELSISLIAYLLFVVFMLRLRKILIFMRGFNEVNDDNYVKNRLKWHNV